MHEYSKTWVRNRVRELRKSMTRGETYLWLRLHNRATGWKIRRQHLVGGYILDFACIELRAGIEIAGFSHLIRGDARDLEREAILQKAGWNVAHLSEAEVVADPDGAVNRIAEWLERLAASPSTVAATSSPRERGEEEGHGESRMSPLLPACGEKWRRSRR